MKTEKIELGKYKITVAEATTLMGMRRTMLRLDGAEKSKDIDDDALRILQSITYPDLIATVTENKGFTEWPISFEAFLDLPERLTGKWEDAVYRLNPHWLPGFEEQEKKMPSGSSENS